MCPNKGCRPCTEKKKSETLKSRNPFLPDRSFCFVSFFLFDCYFSFKATEATHKRDRYKHKLIRQVDVRNNRPFRIRDIHRGALFPRMTEKYVCCRGHYDCADALKFTMALSTRERALNKCRARMREDARDLILSHSHSRRFQFIYLCARACVCVSVLGFSGIYSLAAQLCHFVHVRQRLLLISQCIKPPSWRDHLKSTYLCAVHHYISRCCAHLKTNNDVRNNRRRFVVIARRRIAN